MNGFMGKILRVNLSDKKITEEDLDMEIARKFLGGTGYASKILWDEIVSDTNPLGPKNKLILATGLFTGTGCPGSDSLFSCFKSPLTYCWGEARCGGGMGVELKKTGFDMVIIEGSSTDPVYLWVQDGIAEIRPANHLWGKLVPETQAAIKQEVNEPKARVISIGPAGENLVLFSNLMVENLRAMGRCGGGAVMGSKNLKAIAFKGSRKISVADPDVLKSLIKEMAQLEAVHPESGLSGSREDESGPNFRNGTASFLPLYDECGETPTKNAQANSWGRGEAMYQALKGYITGSEGCLNCTLKCGKRAEVTKGKWKTPSGEYPEYETMVSFGHYLLNDNVEAIIHINHLCNINGVDTISCGNAIAFAMECYEKGWISKKDTGGIDLVWGNMEASKMMIEQIFRREGFGNILADGVRKAAEKIGKGSEDAAMHVKGLELPAHDTRTEEGGKAWAIQYATANRGMCHVHPHEPVILNSCYETLEKKADEFEGMDDPYIETGKGKIVKWAQDYGNAINTLGLCNFHSYLVPGSDPQRYLQVISAVTGWEIDFAKLMEIGERVSNLQRCFNTRDGIRRKDDIIPERLMKLSAFGPFKDRSETEIQNYDAMLDEYYYARGWDKETGIPTPEKLKQLSL